MQGLKPILVQQIRSALLHRTISPVVLSPVRYKTQNKVGRVKAPHAAKQTKKWVQEKDKKTVKLVVKDKRSEESPNWVNRKPLDDVWIRSFYPQQSYSFEDCVHRHREYADPSMLDNMEGLMYADMELNMSTKKKTKFMRPVNGILLLPHWFEDGVTKKIAVFCKSAEDQQKAKDLGATFVGGADLIKQILDAEIKKEEFDFTMCTPDILVDLVPIRSILKDKFPSKDRGSLSPDVEGMMNSYTKGVMYTSSNESDAVGKLQLPLGTLNMSTDELQENLMAYIQSVSKLKAPELGQFISKLMIIAPPSSERFLLNLQEYMS